MESAAAGRGGGSAGLDPCTIRGLNPTFSIASGSFTISKARARWAKRRINPRSSKAVIRRWMPDFDFKSSASFISSNEGGTPSLSMRVRMKSKSSICLRVNIGVTLF